MPEIERQQKLGKEDEANATPALTDEDEAAESAFLASFAGTRIPQNPRLDTKAGQTGCK
jgi:hypothetical protein